ncbi:MAG TPA: endonuclease/exonuclease/phosphatase family protein [Gaiellaceae bacterium]|nr:endonuclease/exonuclease/phosphatase family protein [Gaiellaceae bacterium]
MRHVVLRSALLGSAVLALVVIGGASAVSPNGPSPTIVISQVYGGGGNSSAPVNEDYVELFNRGSSAQPINGWSVQYASSTGAFTQATTLNATVPAGGYYLVGEAIGGNTTAPGINPDTAGSINMSATAGKVIVANVSTALGCGSSTVACTAAQAGEIVDLVAFGSGASYVEGSGPAPGPSNTTADFRGNHGCTDTDDNAADFTSASSPGGPAPRNASATPAPCGGSSGPTSPTVSGSAAPSTVDSGSSALLTARVTPGTNPASTGLVVTGDLSSIGGAVAQTFFDDGTHGDVASGDGVYSDSATVAPGTTPGSKSIPLTVADDQGRSSGGSISLSVTAPAPVEAIHDIQGAAYESPFKGERVKTNGIVTALDTDGFYLQDPTPDASDATSEGIFVFTSTRPTVATGDAVTVTGTVSEFLPGGDAANLTVTEIDSPSVTVDSSGNPLPPPAVIGTSLGDRTPPTQVIDDEATGDANTQTSFDPAHDGLDFWESLEGMRVELDDAVAVGPTNEFGETEVVSSSTAPAADRTPSGGVVVRDGDFNPERVVVDDGLAQMPVMNTGDHYSSPLVGPLTYDFDNFYLEPTQTPTAVHDGAQRTAATDAAPDQLSVATFNVENLAPTDPASKYTALANIVVDNLKQPDIIAVEEVQDNTGAADDGTVAADQTINALTAAIKTAGGPTYQYREIDPQNDQDGGEPGGNIRVVFLFRADRGLSFVDNPIPAGMDPATTPDSVTASGDLLYSPGRVDPANPAWAASRKPLAGEFVFRGQKLFVIANHFVAKLPDDPLEGHVQPPQQQSEAQREAQASAVSGFSQQILSASPNANIVVLGDLNDYQFSGALSVLDATPLHDLITTLPANQQYTYVYEGNSEVLDHILVSENLFAQPFDYDVVHVNSEFADQVSDHDPQVADLTFNRPPTVSAGGPYEVNEGSTITLAATGTDPDGDALTYTWDTGGGSFTQSGQTVQLTPDDGPATIAVRVKATDPYGASTIATATVTVDDVAPVGTFNAPSSATPGGTFALSVTSPSDPSSADTSAGFAYAFDCGSGYAPFSASSTTTCQTGSTPGNRSVGAEIRDKDGGLTAYRATVTVAVSDPFAAICSLARSYSSQKLVADTVCVLLDAADSQAQKGHRVLEDVDLALADLTIELSPRAFTHAQATQLVTMINHLG